MNINKAQDQSLYQKKMVLNNRPYEVLDRGDGKCRIVLVNDLPHQMLEQSMDIESGRYILVNISEAWGNNCQLMTERQINLLTLDIKLLIDIFWLDDATVINKVNGLNLQALQDSINKRNQIRKFFKSYRNPVETTT